MRGSGELLAGHILSVFLLFTIYHWEPLAELLMCMAIVEMGRPYPWMWMLLIQAPSINYFYSVDLQTVLGHSSIISLMFWMFWRAVFWVEYIRNYNSVSVVTRSWVIAKLCCFAACGSWVSKLIICSVSGSRTGFLDTRGRLPTHFLFSLGFLHTWVLFVLLDFSCSL